MKETTEWLMGTVAVIVAILGLAWIIQGNDFFLAKHFAPKQEALRRQTYEQTKSYRQGSVQRLGGLCKQVADADAGHKSMLRDIISHEFAEWNSTDVPDYLRPCLADARAK